MQNQKNKMSELESELLIYYSYRAKGLKVVWIICGVFIAFCLFLSIAFFSDQNNPHRFSTGGITLGITLLLTAVVILWNKKMYQKVKNYKTAPFYVFFEKNQDKLVWIRPFVWEVRVRENIYALELLNEDKEGESITLLTKEGAYNLGRIISQLAPRATFGNHETFSAKFKADPKSLYVQ